MTPRTATTASSVVAPAIAIGQRTGATRRAAAGSSGGSSAAGGWLVTGGLAIGLSMGKGGQTRKEVVVAGTEAGERLDRMLAARIADLSRSRLKALILDG